MNRSLQIFDDSINCTFICQGFFFSIEQESIFTAVCHSVIPSFCHSVNLSKNFNLAIYFQTLSAIALIFQMIIFCDTCM